MLTSAPQSAALQWKALPLPHSSSWNGQATSVQVGFPAGVGWPKGKASRPNTANAATAPPRMKAAATAITVPVVSRIASLLRLALPGSVAGDEILRCRERRAVRARRRRDQLLVIGFRGGAVAELLSGTGGAEEAVESVRLLEFGRLEGSDRLLGHAALEQHEAVELSGRRQRTGRDSSLLGLILGISGRAHSPEGLVVLAFGQEHPGGRDLPLDVDNL